MSITKKITAIGISLTTAVWLSGAIMLMPMVSQAATVEEQIAVLLAEIQRLQTQILALKGGQATQQAYSFTKDLSLGMTDPEVKTLQQFLNNSGYTVSTSGAGSAGSESNYFGSKTQAAVIKYQKANNITPSVGYFGPKTRTSVATSAVVVTTTPTTTTTTTTTVSPTAPATGLAVGLAADNPAAGSLIAGAARVEVVKVNLTAGVAGAVTVNTIKFTKTGVLSDTAINNAYLIEGGKVVAQFSSISGGVITFSGLNLSINAGANRVFTLGIDPSSGLTAGNTVAFALSSAADISAVDTSGTAITPSGFFPMNGNTMTVTTVSNPSIATLTLASSSVGTSVYAGSTGVLVSQWTLTGANSKVNLKSLKFSVIGSAAKNDIANVKLMINGTQVGPTLSSVSSDGSAYFDLTASPVAINTGSSNMQVYADILGSPSFNFDFGILNSFDVNAVDTTYGSPISVTITGGSTGSTSGHQVTINQGAITVTAASDTPTGYVAKGGSGTILAKFNIYAAGEAVKVKFIDLDITANGTLTSELTNVSLVDNAGGQVGSTISTVVDGTTSGYCTVTAGTKVRCHFGTSSSPINYIIPANTTRVISARVDISTSATSTSFTASLPGNSSNLLGLTSSQGANSGAATGAALTLSSSPLTTAVNSGFGNVTYAKGTANAKIGSFTLTASAAEGINVSNLTIVMNASSTNFQNLLVKVDGNQIGSTKSTLSGSDTVTFSGNINIPVGSSKNVDVYADALSSATATTNMGTLTTLSSCTGTGSVTNSSVSCSPTSVSGQSISLATGPTLAVALSSATAPTKQVVMGSTNNSLATFRFTESSNVEPIKITQLIITASSTNADTRASFTNAYLYNGTTPVSGPANASSTLVPSGGNTTSTWVYVFNLPTPVIVPQNGSVELAVKADVATNSSASASSSAAYKFSIASSTTDITAIGNGSNTTLGASSKSLSTTPLKGYTVTVVRSKLTLTAASLGVTSARVRTANDNLANLTFTADAADPVTVNSVSLRFEGVATSVSGAIASFAVQLIDPSTGTDWSGTSAVNCTTVNNSCSTRFNFSTIPTISAGTYKTVTVRVVSTNFYNAASAGDALSVSINTDADLTGTTGSGVNWGDGTTASGLYLESTTVPVNVFSASYD